MNEEYKKLSELPQAVAPNKCEAYGIENGKSVRVPLTFATSTDIENAVEKETQRATQAEQTLAENLNKEVAEITTAITNVTNSLNEETANLKEKDTTLKNTMVKSMVSTNEEFNDVVKELYFDKWVDISKISTISLKRNGIAGENIVWEMYIVDTNGKSSWTSFGKNAETDDVNVSTIGAQEEHFLYGMGVTVYAVIDWSKVTNNNGEGTMTDSFSVKGKMLTSVNNVKYFPKISECLANHKYTHSSVANSIIKELYFENLTKNGTPINDYEFKKFFSLQRIDRNKLSDDGSGKREWSLVFFVKNPDVDTSIQGVVPSNHFFSTITVYPEKDVVVKMPMTTKLKYPNSEGVLTTYTFAATVYAVIDWSKLKNGEANVIIAPLLSGCLDVKNSPIISAYIGNRVEWSSDFNMNDYKTQGVYYVVGERTATADNLPILNTGYISGQITILDANGCVTQYLKLTNAGGSEGKEYVRTFANGSWSIWRELKQTANLGQISDENLKNVVDNGYYEGVILNSYADLNNLTLIIQGFLDMIPVSRGASNLVSGTLFSMEVLNNYAIASEASHLLGVAVPRSVTQVAKIQLVNNGYYDVTSFFIVQRTKVGDVWSNWKMVNVI